MNSLLKFLEEPESDTLAILISEHSDRILETIVSRCQHIPFYKNNIEELKQQFSNEMDAVEAHIVANMSANYEQGKALFESDEFQHAHYLFTTFITKYDTRKELAKVFLQSEGFSKSKRDDKKVLSYFLDMLILLCKDCYRYEKQEIVSIWGKYGEIMLQWEVAKLLLVSVETKDRIVRSVNVPLLVDQMLYRWED